MAVCFSHPTKYPQQWSAGVVHVSLLAPSSVSMPAVGYRDVHDTACEIIVRLPLQKSAIKRHIIDHKYKCMCDVFLTLPLVGLKLPQSCQELDPYFLSSILLQFWIVWLARKFEFYIGRFCWSLITGGNLWWTEHLMWFVTFTEEPPNKATKVYSGIQYVFFHILSHLFFCTAYYQLCILIKREESEKQSRSSAQSLLSPLTCHLYTYCSLPVGYLI